jgi:uncharacterized protein (TIGR01777 family)
MRILMIGATGTIGRRLLLHRLSLGDAVTILSRNAMRTRRLLSALGHTGVPVVEGDTSVPGPWQSAVDGQDAVIILGGAGIADKRWTRRRRTELRTSRVDGVYQVVRAIDRAKRRPSVLLSASAVGYYGDTGSAIVDEYAPAGADELAELCVDWENQAIRAESLCRVVRLRFGVVLDKSGGALRKMLPIFRKGLGGRLGSGRQYMPWIAWPDVIGIVNHLLESDDAQGAYNLSSPSPVTNREFTRTLASALDRPAILPVPGLALRLAVGGLARHLLGGQRVFPSRVVESGYVFRHPQLEGALSKVLHGSEGEEDADAIERPSTPITLVVIDLDGLDVSAPAMRGALRLLERSGCTVVFATQSGLDGASDLLHVLDRHNTVIAADGAIVLINGMPSGEMSRPIGRELVAEILEAMRSVPGKVEIECELFDGQRCRWNIDADPPSPAILESVFRMHIDGDEAARVQGEHLVRERFWKARRVAVHVGRDGRLQVLHPLADRGIAVQEIAKKLGAERNAVGAVVQGERSAGLAEWSGFSVALNGASATMTDLTDATTRAAGTEGLVEAMERWLRPIPTPTEQP